MKNLCFLLFVSSLSIWSFQTNPKKVKKIVVQQKDTIPTKNKFINSILFNRKFLKRDRFNFVHVPKGNFSLQVFAPDTSTTRTLKVFSPNLIKIPNQKNNRLPKSCSILQ